jgi:hypothetical protein
MLSRARAPREQLANACCSRYRETVERSNRAAETPVQDFSQ